jgi:hypothetical protein
MRTAVEHASDPPLLAIGKLDTNSPKKALKSSSRARRNTGASTRSRDASVDADKRILDENASNPLPAFKSSDRIRVAPFFEADETIRAFQKPIRDSSSIRNAEAVSVVVVSVHQTA